MRRKLIFALLALLGLLLVAAVALPYLVDVNRYRGLIQAEAEKALGRKVELGEMKLSLLPTFGIRVADVGIEGLMQAEALTVGARILPLLFGGEIEVSRIVLDRPDITLRRDASGSWNVADLARGEKETAGEADAPARAVSLSHLRLRDATLRLHTPKKGGGDHTIALGLDMTGSLRIARGVTTARAAGRVDAEGLTATIDGGGEWAASGSRFDLAVEGADIEIARARALTEALGQEWPMPAVTGGRVVLSADLEGSWPGAIAGDGSIRLDGVTLKGAARPITARATFEAAAKEAAGLLEVRRLDAEVGRSRIAVSGSVDNRRGGTRVDLTVPTSTVETADLIDLIALTGTALPFEFQADRPLQVEVRVRGDVVDRKDLEIQGAVVVAGGTFRHPSMREPMRDLHGRLAVRRDRLELSAFRALIGGSDVEGTLSVQNLSRPRVEFALASRRADFWELMSFLEEGGEDAAAGPAGPGTTAPGEDVLAVTTGRGTLRIASGSFGTLAFTDLDSTLSLERKVVTLDPVRMTLSGGAVSGKASMNMAAQPPAASVTIRSEGVNVGPLLAENLDMGDMLTGALTGDLSIRAAGDALDAILRSAEGTGTVTIADGRVGAVNVLGVLSKASGLLGEKSLQQVSRRLADEGTEFSKITAGLKVAGGKITTRDFRLVSPDIDLTDDGTLDMLKGTIDIEGRIVFSQPISQAMVDERSRAVDVFWDDRIGRVSLPLTLSGPLGAPKPGIDWSAAGSGVARRKVAERLEKAGLGGLLGGETPRRSAPVADPGVAPDTAEGDPAADPGNLDIRVDRKEFSGNLLTPDLKIRGTLTGREITAATLVVTDRDGRELAKESLMKQVQAVATPDDPEAAASIPFRIEIDGKKLLAAKRRARIQITIEDAQGHRLTRRWDADQ